MRVRPVALGLLGAVCVFVIAIVTKAPREDRDWQAHLSITPAAQLNGDAWTVGPVRDWTYLPEAVASQQWAHRAQISPDAVSRVWLLIEPHPGLEAMAHTLVLFEQTDGSLIGLTIEARKETHERFAPVRGALRRFELIYVWATPRDLLTRRAVLLDRALQLYPLELNPDQRRRFAQAVLARTAALAEAPRFYNTLHSNCTNELAKAAGLSWHPAFVFTGGAGEALHARGLISGADFASAEARAQIGDWVRANAAASHGDFNRGLMAYLSANTAVPISKAEDSR